MHADKVKHEEASRATYVVITRILGRRLSGNKRQPADFEIPNNQALRQSSIWDDILTLSEYCKAPSVNTG